MACLKYLLVLTVTLWTDKLGGFFICLVMVFSVAFFAVIINLGNLMSKLHYRLTVLSYTFWIGCYGWALVSNPGMATVDIIEFEQPLTYAQAE